MSVKVNGQKLHLTTFEIPTTNANVRKCLVAQRDLAKVIQDVNNLDSEDGESIIKSLDSQIKMLDTCTDFLKSILKLSNAQVKKIEESSFTDVIKFASEIAAKVLDVDPNKSKESKSK